jgi:hypothetical protein
LEGLLDFSSGDLSAVEWFSATLLVLVLLLIETEDIVVGSVAAYYLLRAELFLEVGRSRVFVDHLLILLLAAGQTQFIVICMNILNISNGMQYILTIYK